jgi:UDP-2,3-diacylglucosamine hydrolase
LHQTTLFIADLHLHDQLDETYHRFKLFLNSKARSARALYILGDLFEYYLGDDAIGGVAQKVCADLNDLANKHHTQCFFMAGNRDFLIANDFSQLSATALLSDPTVITLDNQDIVLTHADQLCTDDHEYQKIRKQLRSEQWQKSFLQLSIPQRIEFAKGARKQSKNHTQSTDMGIMDVNQKAVNELFKHSNTTLMIHGHTHRPAFHHLTIKQKTYQRMVLGDWHYQSSYIEHKNKHFQLVTY